jgi:hypothetical protein
MGTHRTQELLRALAAHGIERARPELGEEIKARIPYRLTRHGWDTINIIVDLRISRMAAAAVILLAMLLIGRFFASREAADMKVLDGEKAYQAELLGNLVQFRDELIAQGREVVYYGEQAKFKDPCAIIMHWKLSDDRYGVIFGDLTTRTVSAKTLILLQAHMLQSRTR